VHVGHDDGAAVVLALLLGALLVTVALVGATVADLLAARQRAAAAADLGALAGAPVVDSSPTDACRTVESIVRANGARLQTCVIDDAGDVRVVAAAEPRGPFARWLGAALGRLPEPSVAAHAGMR